MGLTMAALLALFACLVVLLIVRRGAARSVPRGTLVYRDADGAGRPLVSPLRPLTGKPDYVLRVRRGAMVPIEYKSYRAGARPPHPDLVQLGAYLLLLEDLEGRRPPYGMLRYADRTVRVRYTDQLREEVLGLLAALGSQDDQPRGVSRARLCRACPFAPVCEDARA